MNTGTCRSCRTEGVPLAELLRVTPTDGSPGWFVHRPGGSDRVSCFRTGVPMRVEASIAPADPEAEAQRAEAGLAARRAAAALRLAQAQDGGQTW